MSMFLASLAFNADAGESINALSRLGILLGSTVSAIIGVYGVKKPQQGYRNNHVLIKNPLPL